MENPEYILYPVQAVVDLTNDFSDEHFKFAIAQIRRNVARVLAEDNSSDQQIARVKILRYLDFQLTCADRWSTESADLMALILRRLIELRFYGKYVSESQTAAGRFLAEADTDSAEMYKLMKQAFPNEMPHHDLPEVQKRIKTAPSEGEEECLFKLCSKFLHPSALVMYDMNATIQSPAYSQMFATRIVY